MPTICDKVDKPCLADIACHHASGVALTPCVATTPVATLTRELAAKDTFFVIADVKTPGPKVHYTKGVRLKATS